MKAALIYSGESKKLESFIRRIFSVIEREGNELKVIKAERGALACNLLPYDLVFIGCSVINFFSGELPSKLVDYIKKCIGLEKKKTIAFIVPSLIGNNKTLKNLMVLLESEGSFVIDFKQIKDVDKDSERLASRLT